MVPIIVLAVLVPLVLFLSYVGLQSEDFSMERSTTIAAPPDVVFAQVNDFHKWDAWSPWAKLDPNSRVTFAGAPAGEGAIFTWSGNNKVGEGRMTITESTPGERVRIKLEFLKPMVATNDTLFTFQPHSVGTLVTWAMSGKNNFVGRVFCTLMNMQKQLAKQFDQGLASMKAIAEGEAR